MAKQVISQSDDHYLVSPQLSAGLLIVGWLILIFLTIRINIFYNQATSSVTDPPAKIDGYDTAIIDQIRTRLN